MTNVQCPTEKRRGSVGAWEKKRESESRIQNPGGKIEWKVERAAPRVENLVIGNRKNLEIETESYLARIVISGPFNHANCEIVRNPALKL